MAIQILEGRDGAFLSLRWNGCSVSTAEPPVLTEPETVGTRESKPDRPLVSPAPGSVSTTSREAT